jgi:hypothetical protein
VAIHRDGWTVVAVSDVKAKAADLLAQLDPAERAALLAEYAKGK